MCWNHHWNYKGATIMTPKEITNFLPVMCEIEFILENQVTRLKQIKWDEEFRSLNDRTWRLCLTVYFDRIHWLTAEPIKPSFSTSNQGEWQREIKGPFSGLVNQLRTRDTGYVSDGWGLGLRHVTIKPPPRLVVAESRFSCGWIGSD